MRIAVARSSSDGVETGFWMTSYFLLMSPMGHVDTVAATPPQRRAQANTLAARYWLRPVLDNDKRQD